MDQFGPTILSGLRDSFFILVTKISRELNTLFIIQRLKTGQSLKEILLLSLAAMKAVLMLL